ncbi:NUDIX hydrolase [Clostridiaceae bacterium 35-E11]
MKTAAIGIVVKNNEVLLVNRKFPPKLWAPPGGFLDPGETPEETVSREVWEETGVTCEVIGKVHEFDYHDAYNDSHIDVYVCKYLSGELECSFESLDVHWFDIAHLPTPISPESSIFEMAVQQMNR